MAGPFFIRDFDLRSAERFGDLGKEEAAAPAEMLEDADAGAAGEEIFAKGRVQGDIDAIGDQDEIDIGIGEERTALLGVSAANGVVIHRLMLVEKAEDYLEDLRISPDDQDIDRTAGCVGNWHDSAYLSAKLVLCKMILTAKLSGSRGRLLVLGGAGLCVFGAWVAADPVKPPRG